MEIDKNLHMRHCASSYGGQLHSRNLSTLPSIETKSISTRRVVRDCGRCKRALDDATGGLAFCTADARNDEEEHTPGRTTMTSYWSRIQRDVVTYFIASIRGLDGGSLVDKEQKKS